MSDYRDVSPNQQDDSAKKIKTVFNYIIKYLRNPLTEIKTIPDWNWPTLLVTIITVSMVSGLLMGIIPPNFFRIISGLIISPIVAVVTAFVSSLFIYYYFQVFEKRTCSLKKIFTLVLFANIPFFIFQALSEMIPPISLVGFAFTSLITAVGLTENFNLEKRRSLRLVSILYAAVILIWIWNRVDF